MKVIAKNCQEKGLQILLLVVLQSNHISLWKEYCTSFNCRCCLLSIVQGLKFLEHVNNIVCLRWNNSSHHGLKPGGRFPPLSSFFSWLFAGERLVRISLAKSLKSLASCFKMSFSFALSSRPTVSCPVIFAQLLTQRSISWSDHTKKNTLYIPVKTKLQHLPLGKPRAFDAFSCPGGWKFWSPLTGGGEFDH